MKLEDAGTPDQRDEPLAATKEERARQLLQPLANAPSVVERQAPRPGISDRRLDERIMECTMENVVLSFAGWRAEGSEAHRAIAALAPGDPLSLLHEDGQWKVFDDKGRQVGRMARKWAIPNGMRIVKAAVHGIFTRWAKDESDEERKQRLRSESWEVVVLRFCWRVSSLRQGTGLGAYSFSEKLGVSRRRGGHAIERVGGHRRVRAHPIIAASISRSTGLTFPARSGR